MHRFFYAGLDDLHDPFLLKDMDQAIERLVVAISNEEKIMVYGDYDVDGTTAVSMMYSFLTAIDQNVVFYIPDRYKEGYGVSLTGIRKAEELGCSLIITLDCGIRAVEQADLAKKLGIDLIICDHHEPGIKVPKAAAILNPKQKDCSYPFDGISGAGVAFKFIHAFCIQHSMDEKIAYSFLDLLAVSIAADIVPMIDENRILVREGLKMINQDARPGIKALLQNGNIGQGSVIRVEDLVFTVAPRINAAGRMMHANLAVALLTSLNLEDARQSSGELEIQNQNRKTLDAQTTSEALKLIANDQNKSSSTVVSNKTWHKGVIGIVASRLQETYYKPTVVFSGDDELLTGSARSITGFDIHKGLEECESHIEKYGGHSMAAGLIIKPESLNDFTRKFEEVVQNQLNKSQNKPVLDISADLDFERVSRQVFDDVQSLAPFGPENMAPLFIARHVRDNGKSRLVGSDKSHLKLNLIQKGRILNGIGFKMGKYLPMLRTEHGADIVFRITENNWMGKSKIEIELKDLRPSESR